jgi:hypothetical protein
MKARPKKESRPAPPAGGDQTAVRRYRQKMRHQGMRLVQFWAPDANAPGFAEECRRQSLLAAADKEHEGQILDEIGALSADLDIGTAPDFVMPHEKKK